MTTDQKQRTVDFAVERESINIYRLEDGNTLRMKTTVLRIIKTGGTNPDGTPQYKVIHNTSMDVETAPFANQSQNKNAQ